MKDTPENRKKLNIPLGAKIDWIDLDEQQPSPEIVTGGWTDSQIHGKTVSEIDFLIKQNEMAADSLEKSLAQQRQVIYNLQQVRHRKFIIGGA